MEIQAGEGSIPRHRRRRQGPATRGSIELQFVCERVAPAKRAHRGAVAPRFEATVDQRSHRAGTVVVTRQHGGGLVAGHQLDRGVAYWKLGELRLARNDFETYIRSGAEGAPWIRLWIWSIAGEQGDSQGASTQLEEVAKSGDVLLGRVLGVIRGEAEPDKAVEAANGDGELLMVNLGLGLHAFAEGHRRAAEKYFEAAEKVGLLNWTEHELAVWHLARLRGQSR